MLLLKSFRSDKESAELGNSSDVTLRISFEKHRQVVTLKCSEKGTSLVVQWLRICLPMQGTQVRSLVREDPTCHRATKPTSHNY